MTDKLFEFKFYDGQVFRGRGAEARDALRKLGLGAYNPVAYDVREITGTETEVKASRMTTKLKEETVTVELWAWLGMIVTELRKIANENDIPTAADTRLREIANHLQDVANANRK